MNGDNFSAQIIAVFLAETVKNVAKGSASLVYNNFNLLLYSEITALGLSNNVDAEGVSKQLEAKPEILETVRQKLNAHPQLAEEMSKITNHTINNFGLSYSEVNDIAYDVFRQNFDKLSAEAMAKVNERLDKFIEMVLRSLINKNSDLLNSFREPGMQLALYSAQKSYVKTGDVEVTDLLIDMLVERAEQNEWNLLQIILEDTLEIIPKLNNQQLDVLSLLFLFNHDPHKEIANLESFKDFLEKQIKPFTEYLTNNPTCYSHLQYANCVIGAGGDNLGIMEISDFFERFNGYGKGVLFKGAKSQEIKEFVYKQGEYMQKIYGVWNTSGMNHTSLTPVGMALAIANIKRKTGHCYNLSDWIK